MSEDTKTNTVPIMEDNPRVKALFDAGVHFGYSKSKRHPSTRDFIFGLKNRVEILDLTKVIVKLDEAKAFMESVGATGRQVLFVSSKGEAEKVIKETAEALEMPYVIGRWLGGTLTNLSELGKRIKRLVDLIGKREKGELSKYTKKERLMIDREIEKLEEMFGGLLTMRGLPGVIYVIDPKKEKTTIFEARRLNIPVVALMNSDNNIKDVDYPIIGNDSVTTSIELVTKEIAESFKIGRGKMVKREEK